MLLWLNTDQEKIYPIQISWSDGFWQGKQLEGGIFRRKLTLFGLSSICEVRNVEPNHARCSAVLGHFIAFQWYSDCPGRSQQLWVTWVLGIHTEFVHFGNMSFTNSEERSGNMKWHYISDNLHFYGIFLSYKTELGSADWNGMLFFVETIKRINCLQLDFSVGAFWVFFPIKLKDYYWKLAVGAIEKGPVIYTFLFMCVLALWEMLIAWHGSFLFCFPGSQVHQ